MPSPSFTSVACSSSFHFNAILAKLQGFLISYICGQGTKRKRFVLTLPVFAASASVSFQVFLSSAAFWSSVVLFCCKDFPVSPLYVDELLSCLFEKQIVLFNDTKGPVASQAARFQWAGPTSLDTSLFCFRVNQADIPLSSEYTQMLSIVAPTSMLQSLSLGTTL